MHGNQAGTSPISMLTGTNNNPTSSVTGNPGNYRPQSPFARTAHPGAVLMSPQSATRSPQSASTQQQQQQQQQQLQQQQQHASLSQYMSAGNINGSNNNNQLNSASNNNKGSILSFDDMLERASYIPNGNIPSIQQPIPLSSTSSSPTPVPHMNFLQTNTSNNMTSLHNNTNSNTFSSVTGQTLLSPRVQSPLLQQYISSPVEQPQNQFLDVPSSINILNNSTTTHNGGSLISNNNPTTTPNSGISQTIGFSQDLTRVHHWIQNLSVQQQTIVMDNILSVLSDNVLSYTRSAIDNMLPSSSYVPNMHTSSEEQYNPELLNLDSLLINGNRISINDNNQCVNSKNNIAHINANTNHNTLISNNINNNNINNNSNIGSSVYHPWSPQPVPRKQTILDMERPKSVDPVMMIRRNPHQQQSNTKQIQDNTLKAYNANTNINNNNNKTSSPIANYSMTPENLTNPALLKTIPAWLKSLRLHKYSDCLSDLTWQQLIYLNDQALEAKGVTALGARRKLLKAFNIVKDCKENNLIDKSAY